MPEANYPIHPAMPLTRALSANSFAGSFQTLSPQVDLVPWNLGATNENQLANAADGVWEMSLDGDFVSQTLLIIPYAESAPTPSNFYMRVWGWKLFPGSNAQKFWIPILLLQFQCTTCALTGPQRTVGVAGPANLRRMEQHEYLCDTIQLVVGNSYPDSDVISPGSQGVNDCGASVEADTRGCQMIQFDFQQIDSVGMNAFWARA